MARKRDWQEKFENFKTFTLKIFFNEPLSPSQEVFLYWLKAYNQVFEEKSSKDFDILTDKVIEDHILVDAYFAFASERHKEGLLKSKKKDTLSRMESDLKQPLKGMNAMTINYE